MGKEDVQPVQPRRTFTKINCEFQPFLYRINGKKICRVPLAASSLHSESSFILVDEHRMGGKVYVWCGADSLIFAKNLARQIGQEISHDELHEWRDACFQFEQGNLDTPTPEELTFWERLGEKNGRPSTIPSAGEVDTSPCRLFRYEQTGGGSGSFSPMGESLQFDWAMLSPSNGAVLLDCGEGEIYLWLGVEATEAFRQEAIAAGTAYMKAQATLLRASLVIIEPADDGRHNEKIVLFHQRFSKFGTRRAGEAASPRALQAVVAEVERMCAKTTGTLRYVAEDSDGAMSGHVLPMRLLLDDTSAKLQHYRMADGAWTLLPPERAGVFASEEALAVLFSCKNGSRRVLYLWSGEGKRAVQARGAIAVKATELDGRADQIQLQQGTEPPFFLLAHEQMSSPAVLVNGQVDDTAVMATPSSPAGAATAAAPKTRDDDAELAARRTRLPETRIFAASASSAPFLGGRRGPLLAEQDPASLYRHGLAPRRSYVVVHGLPAARLADGASWPEARISVYHGELSPPACRALAEAESKAEGRLCRFLTQQHNLPASTATGSAPAAAVSVDAVAAAVTAAKPDAFLEAEEEGWPEDCSSARMVDATRGFREQMSGDGNAAGTGKGAGHFPQRPLRLFLVSATTRATGAMFVREIGGGDTFRQADLESHESYVLDAGDSRVFVWQGPTTTAATRELGVEIGRSYCEEIARQTGSVVPALVEVFSAEEPAGFAWCFRQWRHCRQTAAKVKLHISVTGGAGTGTTAASPATATKNRLSGSTSPAAGVPPRRPTSGPRECRSMSPVPSSAAAARAGGGGRSLSPAGKKSRTYHKHDCVGNLFLYRVDRKRICRVPLAPSSLDRDSSFILVDEQRMGGKVYVWCGRDCQVLAKNLAKQLGQEISHDELHEWKDSFFYFEDGETAASPEAHEAFWKALGAAGGAPPAVEKGASDGDGDGLPMVLYQIDPNTGDAARAGESTSSFDWGALSPADGAVLLECPQGELYLWIGERCPEERREQFRAAGLRFKAQADLAADCQWAVSSLVILEPPADSRHNEKVVLFHQRFSKFGTKKAVMEQKETELVPVEVEVERMHSPHTGTLRIIEEQVDLAMSGHPIPFSLIDDETAALESWRMVNKGGGAWVFDPVPPQRRGIYTSEDAFAVLYTCKNGARRVLYLWNGSGEGAMQSKGALALKAAELDRRADQVQLMQGEEAPFFLVAHARIGCSLVISKGSAGPATGSPVSPRSPAAGRRSPSPSNGRPTNTISSGLTDMSDGPRVWAVGVTSSLPSAYGKSGLWAVEQDANAVRQSCLCRWRSYVVVSKGGGDGAAAVVKLWHGEEASPAVRAFAEQLADPAGRLLPTVLDEAAARTAGAGTALTGAIGETELLLLVGGGGGGSVGSYAAPMEAWLGAARPLRLFKVSGTTRATGAMFVREIGPGECFRQQDLEQHESFIIDAGRATVFLWHGAAAGSETRALGVEVSLQYIQTLPGLKKDSRFEVCQVYAGREPAELVWCFRQWDSLRHAEYAATAAAPAAIVLSATAAAAMPPPPASAAISAAPADTGAGAADTAARKAQPQARVEPRPVSPSTNQALPGPKVAAEASTVSGPSSGALSPGKPEAANPLEPTTGGGDGGGGGVVDAETMLSPGRYDEFGNIRHTVDGSGGGRSKLASLMSKFEKGA